MENIQKYLQMLPFYGRLSDTQRKYLENSAFLRRYDKGGFLYGGDNACLGMIYIISGGVRTYLLSEEGREITLFRLKEGDSCVLSASCIMSEITFETHMVTETDCRLLIIGTEAFGHMVNENIYVKCFQYEMAAKRFSAVMFSIQQILFSKLDRRLSAFLLSEYKRTGSRVIYMTHEEIARQINSAREVVARMLKRFAADGLVELRRGSVKLLDTDGLDF
ncbi:MAG: Crp/Fnr family transcriptional regulator [Clostridia bacterium]|nr:Crp/Fnr family transcriptional regulator [Clostridia bacterium]